jgi:Zn-dependent M28 family amino/carboxypeptidase
VARSFPNVICKLPGESGEAIVVGAHYDKVAQGNGAVDNWTGVVLLPSLYQSLAGRPRKFTFIFAGFADEEKGLVGSRSFVRDMKKTGLPVIAMVNIDSVGMTPTKVWAARADKQLLQLAASAAVAVAAAAPLSAMSVDRVGDSDSHPFQEKKIPVIDFHSLTQENFGVLHTDTDQLGKIDRAAYSETCRFLSVLLAYLDAKLVSHTSVRINP